MRHNPIIRQESSDGARPSPTRQKVRIPLVSSLSGRWARLVVREKQRQLLIRAVTPPLLLWHCLCVPCGWSSVRTAVAPHHRFAHPSHLTDRAIRLPMAAAALRHDRAMGRRKKLVGRTARGGCVSKHPVLQHIPTDADV